ncbi:hypothetical protein LRR81_11935 [Metabacillus sp. GX 13764]|uniref:NAD-dependent epimerase/dehydratase family protein n=1 Tax=Metabacillus kandeliae TaxID=2900151 RepID=UPI001E4C222A|nr:NAD-dependent epimerase/dehydratase family protein [Metabacillus kandeliae]MCD7034958.1 hypothetical protein [Metabacillus kandeliae]
MDTVMIYGMETYAGFALCEKFLQEGIPVCGIYDIEGKPAVQKQFEDKMMLIGRNALLEARAWTKDFVFPDEPPSVVYCAADGEGGIAGEEQVNALLSWASAMELQFLLLSSLDVFGEEQLVITEETAPEPDTDRGKRLLAIEKAAAKAYSNTENRYGILRLPVLYGPGMPADFMSDKKNPPMRGLLFISDAVSAIVKNDCSIFFRGMPLYLASERNEDMIRTAQALGHELTITMCGQKIPNGLTIECPEVTPIEEKLSQLKNDTLLKNRMN